MSTQKYPIDPKSLAQVRDEALLQAKKSGKADFIALAAIADEILSLYTGQEAKDNQKKKMKISIG